MRRCADAQARCSQMNGEKLTPDHGFPLRLVAPGTAGCRNAKWVVNLSVTERPSELDSGTTLDRHFSPVCTALVNRFRL